MKTDAGISFKLAALVLISSIVILTGVLGYNFSVSKTLIVDLAEENSRNLGHEVASFIASELRPVETQVKNMALALENTALSEEDLTALTRRVIQNNPAVFGMAIALEPFSQSQDQLFFSPYSYRDKTAIITTFLGSPEYRYFTMDWYLLPKELERAVWTEPYFDTGGGNSLMTTFTAPFYKIQDGKRTFAGVLTADILLDWLQEKCSQIRLYDTGYCVLLSGRGTFLYHPKKQIIMNETIFSLAEFKKNPALWEIGRSMINGKTEFVEHDNLFNAIPGFLMYMPLSVGNWSLGFFFPKSEVLKDVNTLSGNMLIIGMCGFLALTAAVILISRKITLPLQLLSAKTMEIASGNLETKLPMVRSKDEVGQLTEAFQHMQQSLIKHIDDLTQTTAQKERIESELRIAREIQMGILPKLFPPFPDRDEFDIFASIEPAREVGGDLYDFFFLDRNHFCFLIGDVSGKGVPAAFFMAVTKTLLKVVADRDRFPDKILSSVNNDLASDNDSCMFVTLFLAIMDIDTGEIDYACAGHNPPILMTENGARYLKVFNEPMAGAMEGISYSSAKVNLAPGETILLYTDGVTEAMNPSNDLFSDQQLMDLLSALYEPGEEIPDPEPMIKAVTQSLSDFVQGAEPSDDITMLAVKYKNPILKQK